MNIATATVVNVHGLSPGTATVTFTPDCGGAVQAVIRDILVKCTPPGIPVGPALVTVGSLDITLTANQASAWTIASGGSCATLNNVTDSTVNVHAVSAGVVTVSVTPSCGGTAQTITKGINVNAAAGVCVQAPAFVTSPATVMVSATLLIANQPGLWSSSSASATISSVTASSSAAITSDSNGSAVISFTPTDAACAVLTQTITVNLASAVSSSDGISKPGH